MPAIQLDELDELLLDASPLLEEVEVDELLDELDVVDPVSLHADAWTPRTKIWAARKVRSK